MARFPSLEYNLSATRAVLRDRFARSLYGIASQRLPVPQVVLADEDVLGLLENLTVVRDRETHKVRSLYAPIRADNPGAPTFDELLSAGWLREVRGEVRGQTDVMLLRRSNTPLALALMSLQAGLHARHYSVADPDRHNASLALVVEELTERPRDVRPIVCRSPVWIAARLWERVDSPSDDARMNRWLDGWTLLGRPSFVPSHVWGPNDAETFIEAAMAWLSTPGMLLTWDELAHRRALHAAMLRGDDDLLAPPPIDAWPPALVDRADLVDEMSESHFRDHMQLMRGGPHVTGLLLDEVVSTRQSQGPHPLAAKLLGLAVARPELLVAFNWRVRNQPVLLADLCLFPATAPLACVWAARMPPHTGAWRSPAIVRQAEGARVQALEDALDVCRHFLQGGQLEAGEFTPVIKRACEWRADGRASIDRAGTTLHSAVHNVLLGQTTGMLTAMVDLLLDDVAVHPPGHAALAAALDVVATGMVWDTVEPGRMVKTYLNVVNGQRWRSPARYIDQRGAASLLWLATRAGGRQLRSFLHAVDVQERISAPVDGGHTRYEHIDDAGHALRAHVAILCRSISGSPGAVSDVVIDALVENIKSAFFTDGEYGPIDAFSPRHGLQEPRQAGALLAADLASVLDRLGAGNQKKVLNAILKSTEPLVLAQLQALAPESVRAQIGQRISVLGTTDAAPIFSLPALQMRVEWLINAGSLDAAQRFLDEETAAKTLGVVPGRDDVRLRLTLRLMFARGEFEAIESFALSQAFPAGDAVSRDIVEFFRALAWMQRENGSMALPIDLFARLHGRHPAVSAYAINLIAARIRSVMPEDSFAQVDACNREEARRVLFDAASLADSMEDWTPEDRDLFGINRAILLLATGNPGDALELLATVVSSTLKASAMAFFAVALARNGRGSDAVKMLDSAAASLGDAPLLAAARAQIQYGTPYGSSVLVATGDGASGDISLRYFLAKSPYQQAVLYFGSVDGARAGMINDVRVSAGNVANLAVVLRQGKTHPKEDDITKVFAALLEARKRFVGWAWHEQSPGGLNEKGREGRRDVALVYEGNAHAVVEAVVCDRPLTTKWASGELLSHYRKLFAYAPCRLFFHVLYSYVENPDAVVEYLKTVAETQAPEGFVFARHSDLETEPSLPPGFQSRYYRGDDEVDVVFVVIDMLKAKQAQAAKSAAEANPRNTGLGPSTAL
jgi:hypothetical protein